MWKTSFTQDTDKMNNGTLTAVYTQEGFTITHSRRVDLSDSKDVEAFTDEAKQKLASAKAAYDSTNEMLAAINTQLNS